MKEWQKQERFEALLSGELTDRPIISGWRHFLDKEQNADDLAETTIAFTKQFEWDWVKINPRATYLAEIWGNTFDFHDYNWVFPKQTLAAINKPEDVWDLQRMKPASSPPLLEQLDAAKKIREGLPDTPLTQTIFSPLTVLLFLAGQAAYASSTVYGSDEPVILESLFVNQRAGVHHALRVISETLADYVKELESIGIDGVFYAVTGTAHPELFHEDAFNEFSRPYDSIVLDAVSNGKTILHTCGAYAHPERFNDYDIDGISWDTKATGNPGLDADLKATKIGGVAHELFIKDSSLILEESEKALKEMEGKPFLLAPNCAIPPSVTDEALYQFQNSVMKKGAF
ncbi:uroporphyrinogen decarboxylase family protein [Halalkalibacter lacteus]|uniref:uroporphyrinogen decarboxylase family protein n=1 Tax=Halalkalibacter lacteus TaxID=3090663 RepID=UPI002FCADD3B